MTSAGTEVRESMKSRFQAPRNGCVVATAVKCMASQVMKRLRVSDAHGHETSLLRLDLDSYYAVLSAFENWIAVQLTDGMTHELLLLDFTDGVPEELNAFLADAGLRNPVWPQFAVSIGCKNGVVLVKVYDNPKDPRAHSAAPYVAPLL